MRIQHNIAAMNSYRNYTNNANSLSKNLEKLSSGYKINRAGDDAAGLAISEKMRAQITGLDAAQKNVQDGISLVKTAEGAMQEIQDMLNRMKYLATQSANGTYQDKVDREALQDEVDALTDEIDRIAQSANFNGQKLLDGTLGSYTSTANTTEVDGVVKADAIKLVGGDLAAGDGIQLTHAKADGSIDLKQITVAGITVAKDDLADKGLAYEVIAPEDSAHGTYTVKITVDDKTKATADIADAIGEGLTATITTQGSPADDADYTFTTDGTGGGLNLQIGDDGEDYNQLSVVIQSLRSEDLGVTAINVKDIDSANEAVDTVVDIINTVSSQRGRLGAIQNRLEHTANNLSVMEENIQNAESAIRDTDIADEMTAYTKNNILLQSAQAMLAQANQMPQGVLQLLQ